MRARSVAAVDLVHPCRVLASAEHADAKRRAARDLLHACAIAPWGAASLDDVRRAMARETSSSTSLLEAAMLLADDLRAGRVRRLGRESLIWVG